MPEQNVELVVIGDELLAGAIQDANAGWLADRLLSIGISVSRVTFAPDGFQELKETLEEALARAGFVISCGGLGPTADDCTRAVAADLFDRELYTNKRLLNLLAERYKKLGRRFDRIARTQAQVSRGAELLANPAGAAPGVVLKDESRTLILLPGVPGQMRAITETALLPYLEENLALSAPHILLLRTVGAVETELAQRIRPVLARFPDLKISYLPRLGGVDLRIQAPSESKKSQALKEFSRILEDDLYAVGREDLSEVVGRTLLDRGQSVAVAESCTGGMLASRLVDVAGSSRYFMGGVVSYSNRAKQELLGVASGVLELHGAVSSEVAKAMAEGVRERLNSTCGIGITGIAGPGGATRTKPVGLVYIALAWEDSVRIKRFVFPGDRSSIRQRSVVAALDLLRRYSR
ncbi:MAG: competence/damage-inducible protein A [candidate division WOR-3 bacterium]|nr:competence/damage-inducible protein A [candidate division WOR-3 bacterium]